MKRHIKYIIFEIAPCKYGDCYSPVLNFYNEEDANKFLKSWHNDWDWNFTVLKLMKVLS